MAYTIEVENDKVFLKQGKKSLGVLGSSTLDKRLFKHIDKLKFSTIQNTSYDFSTRDVTSYTKEKVRNKIFFNFEKLDCEIYYSVEDGKLYDSMDQEIPPGKISGNFRNIKATKQAENFLYYLQKDVLNSYANPSIKTAMLGLGREHIANIRKMHTLEIYLTQYELKPMDLDNVTKDVVNMLREKKNRGEEIYRNILTTVHMSKEYHATYIKCLQDDSTEYFDMLYSYKDKFVELIGFYNYDEVSLVNYVSRITKTQNISLKDTMQCLYDYANVYSALGIAKFDKYPKYLRSMHDMATAKLNDFKLDNNVDLKGLYKFNFSEYRIDNSYAFNIRVPNNTKEIIEEGVNMRHCVASYVTNVLKGKTKIIFLRDGHYSSGKPLLTLEVKEGKLIQARGKLNRAATAEEVKFMQQFCIDKKLEYKV